VRRSRSTFPAQSAVDTLVDVVPEPSTSVTEIGGYHAIRTLARSAAVDVLLATNREAGANERKFVLRVLGEKYARDERFRSAFTRAATAYGRLIHPAIVQVHELLEFEGRPVIVLDHVDGAALNRARGMLRAVGYGIDDMAALHIAAECSVALAAAHAARDDSGGSAPILHRYLGPAKVLIGWDGSIKIRDFGLPEPTTANQQSFVGVARGADGYMAPEQVNGKEATPRTDVYSAAILLWELLTKKRAFQKSKRQVEMWRAMADPRVEALDTLRPDLDRRLRELLCKALDPRVEKRTVTAKDMAILLRELISEESGREHLAGLMEMIRHEPSPVLSEPPPEIAGMGSVRIATPGGADKAAVRGSMPTVDMSAPAKTAARPAAAQSIRTSATSGNVVAARVLADPSPELKRTSSSKIPAVKPASDTAPKSVKRLSSGAMPATRSVAAPSASRTTSSAKIRAVDPAPASERSAPARTSSAKMPAVAPRQGPPPIPAAARRSSGRMEAAKPPPLPAAAANPPPRPASAPKLSVAAASGRAKPPPLPPPAADAAAPSANGASANDAGVDTAAPRSEPKVFSMDPVDEPAPAMPAPGDPSSFASLPKVLVVEFPQADRSEPLARAAVAPAVASAEDDPEPDVPIEVGASVVEPLPVESTEVPHARASAAVAEVIDRLGDRQSDGASTSDLDLASLRPRQRSERRMSVLFGLLSLGGVIAADRLGYVQLPYRDQVADRIRGWVAASESKLGSSRRVATKSRQIATPDLATSAPPKTAAPETPPAVPASSPAVLATGSATTSPPASSVRASPSVSTSPPAIAPGMGLLKTTDLAGGRRIFVDERTVGQTPESVLVKCGTRSVKIGSSGRRQVVDVPCSGEINVEER
jgi:eukaryotic-like serine/threonine-protein kinase